MKLSLSTNWCCRHIEHGEEIAELAADLGFDELELGYATYPDQAQGFKRRLDLIPVGSVHAFAPLPISASFTTPELYQLATLDDETRKMARFQVLRTVRFASDMGADTVVLHAGRIPLARFLRPMDSGMMRNALQECKNDVASPRYVGMLEKARGVRTSRGRKILDALRAELESLSPELEKARVTLAFENMPYYEGFPLASEAETVMGWGIARIKMWYDTGHARVCACHGWSDAMNDAWLSAHADFVAGMHLNDVVDVNDDHLAPGFGKVDFAAIFGGAAAKLPHLVFEPNAEVSEKDLRKGIEFIRSLQQCADF